MGGTATMFEKNMEIMLERQNNRSSSGYDVWTSGSVINHIGRVRTSTSSSGNSYVRSSSKYDSGSSGYDLRREAFERMENLTSTFEKNATRPTNTCIEQNKNKGQLEENTGLEWLESVYLLREILLFKRRIVEIINVDAESPSVSMIARVLSNSVNEAYDKVIEIINQYKKMDFKTDVDINAVKQNVIQMVLDQLFTMINNAESVEESELREIKYDINRLVKWCLKTETILGHLPKTVCDMNNTIDVLENKMGFEICKCSNCAVKTPKSVKICLNCGGLI